MNYWTDEIDLILTKEYDDISRKDWDKLLMAFGKVISWVKRVSYCVPDDIDSDVYMLLVKVIRKHNGVYDQKKLLPYFQEIIKNRVRKLPTLSEELNNAKMIFLPGYLIGKDKLVGEIEMDSETFTNEDDYLVDNIDLLGDCLMKRVFERIIKDKLSFTGVRSLYKWIRDEYDLDSAQLAIEFRRANKLAHSKTI